MKEVIAISLAVLWITARAGEPPAANTAGVGLVLGVEGQIIIVKAILPDSPAAVQKSVHVGDKIVAIAQDKEAPAQVRNGNLAQAVRSLRGAPGTMIHLTIAPAGEDDSHARVVTFFRQELKALSRWGDGALLPTGITAPDIEMVRLPKGERERLSDYADKIVVLEFWATWCEPCQSKMADLQRYAGRFPDWKGNVLLISANVDNSAEIAAKHLRTHGWDQTHNVWVGTNAIKAFHVDAIPTAYVIDRHSKIVTANPASIPDVVNALLDEGQRANKGQ